jgi:amidohydrolase
MAFLRKASAHAGSREPGRPPNGLSRPLPSFLEKDREAVWGGGWLISRYRVLGSLPKMSSHAAPPLPSLSERLDRCLAELEPEIVKVRRHLHSYPELSGNEHATTAFVAEHLEAAGISYELGSDGRGIITEISGKSAAGAPAMAFRADLDALPIVEENDVPYRSRNAGVMHACGHDAHTAILLGTLCALKSAGPAPAGWRGIFQPSEEAGHGAREMIRRGALEGICAIVALHVDPTIPAGELALTAGPQTAFCQDFEVEVCGRGGHGARPHHAVDPIAIAAQLVTLIYQAVPRSNDARDPLVVTIGQIEGGHAANVIPDKATLKGTIRALDATVLRKAGELIERLCRGSAEALGGVAHIAYDPQLPGVVNDPHVTAICLEAARAVVGADNVLVQGRPSMGAEDFADYLAQAPGCMIRLGVGRKGKKTTPLHTSIFDIEESALLVGARLMTQVLLHLPVERSA